MVKKEPAGLTLTKVTKMGRNFVKYFAITLVVLMVGRVTLAAAVAYWKATHPPKPPEPTAGFGLLPPLEFPELTDDQKPSSYKLETASGTLPTFKDRATVFLVKKGSPNLLDNENAKQVASRYGFSGEPQVLNSKLHRWTKNQPFITTFDLDIVDFNFKYETDFLNRPELILDSDLPTDFDAVQQVKTFLNTANLLPSDTATSAGQITYLKALGGILKPAVSISDADFVQVDLNRSAIDNSYDIYTEDAKTGAITAILTGGRSGNSILKLVRQYFPIDYSLSHTYYIRTPQSAWQTLQSGEGYIANKGTADTAVIRTVEMGYYESSTYQQYYQPIYVFKGDGDFVGYVSAIDPRYILQAGNLK
jgi:hypothetical protein